MTGSFTRSLFSLLLFVFAVCLSSAHLTAQSPSGSLGMFEGQSDVGSVTPAGTAVYDAATGVYTLTAAGTNLWSTIDGFHLVWKKMSGNLSLSADIGFPVTAGEHNPHRKAILIFRQTLDADAVYADAALHGVGLTALQSRAAKGAETNGIELNIAAPRRLRLTKRGDTVTMFLSMVGEPLHPAGASIKLHLDGPFYVGIGLCSHDKNVVETATFSNVELKELAPPAADTPVLFSTLETIAATDNTRREIVYTERGRFEAPNWTKDDLDLIFNGGGNIFTIPVNGGTPTRIDTGDASGCTGSHGLSPDGKLLAITCTTPAYPGRRVFIIPFGGGTPRILTEHPDSYFHSWSPDGKTIAFTRPSHGSGNIFSIPVEGGAETALTTGTGISDDPDYSADGKYIYFNSDRGGSMEIWRMKPDGAQPEQITFDGLNSWTPHPSPDGKWIVFVSYGKGTAGHLANKDVELRILSTADNKIRVLTSFVGGDGSMNVSFWAPDSKNLAFVSYESIPAVDVALSK
jgi:Tol biopolymer transport system component